jgi:CubicO group peptidase (beta-lactamase class C family)
MFKSPFIELAPSNLFGTLSAVESQTKNAVARALLPFFLIICLSQFVCGCRTTFTPLPSKETRTYQSILEWSQTNGMPGAILLVQTPKTNFLSAVGYAEVKKKIPLRPDLEFHIASITKMFVGVTAVQLQRDGLLDTDLAITNYLPRSITDHIANSDQITVRELLRMQSGIYNFTDSLRFQLRYLSDHRGHWPPLRCLKYAYDKPARFPPGKGWQYNNSNFILLGLIIEKVTGHPLAVEIRKRILDPLQLTNTYYELAEPAHGELVHDYERVFGLKTDVTGWTTSVSGAAGMVSTAADLATFVRAICGTNGFLDGPTRELLRSEVRSESKYAGSRDPAYPVLGYDWGINWTRAVDDNTTPVSLAPVFFGHEGDGIGSLCLALHDPKNDITIVWFGSTTLLGFPLNVDRSRRFQHALLEKALFELTVEQTRGE